LTKPVLASHGARDRELDAATNLAPLVRFLGEAGNADFTVATIPDLDHWMWVTMRRDAVLAHGPRSDHELDPEALSETYRT
jgi:hypothetical protein